MFIDFKSFLESFKYSEQWLLCIFFKSEASAESTQKPTPKSKNDIVFEDYFVVDKHLTFDDVIKKPEKFKLGWNYVAVSMSEPNRSEYEIKNFLSDMRNKLEIQFKMFAIFDREGFFINPSEFE
jgi:hypothetical protein